MEDRQDRKLKSVKWACLIIVQVLLVIYISIAISIYSYSRQNEPCQADTAVVLGAAVFTDAPSPVFEERINHAVNLYNNGKIKKIIFTGGKDESDVVSEAEAAKIFAINAGVATSDILLETDSWTTYSNLVNANEIIKENNIDRVMIISDPLHLKRASMIASELDIPACTSATPTTKYKSLSKRFPFLLRESYFYIQHLILKI